jgi:hypothetical protein
MYKAITIASGDSAHKPKQIKRGNEGIAPCLLKSCKQRQAFGQINTQVALPLPRVSLPHPHPLNGRLHGTQCGGKLRGRNNFRLLEIVRRFLGLPFRSRVTVPTEITLR